MQHRVLAALACGLIAIGSAPARAVLPEAHLHVSQLPVCGDDRLRDIEAFHEFAAFRPPPGTPEVLLFGTFDPASGRRRFRASARITVTCTGGRVIQVQRDSLRSGRGAERALVRLSAQLDPATCPFPVAIDAHLKLKGGAVSGRVRQIAPPEPGTDVFNVFNSGVVLQSRTEGSPFETPTEILGPRMLRFGARICP